MKYGKKAVRKKQRALNARSSKWGRKIAVLLLQAVLILVLGIGIIGGVVPAYLACKKDVVDVLSV